MLADQEQTAGDSEAQPGDGRVTEPSLAATGETPEIADQPAGTATDGNTQLQDVLPEITQLAQRVGGFRRLAELIDTLEHAKG